MADFDPTLLPDTVTGYSYMADGTYAGEYVFPRNKDKEEIHVPPFTTLVPPPMILAGKKATWNGLAWALSDLPLPQWLEDYEYPQPGWLELPYIARMKKAGVYELFVHAYFVKGFIPEDSVAAFDALVQAGVDQRIADHQRALDTDAARIAKIAAEQAANTLPPPSEQP